MAEKVVAAQRRLPTGSLLQRVIFVHVVSERHSLNFWAALGPSYGRKGRGALLRFETELLV
jgi:hypothetical protein